VFRTRVQQLLMYENPLSANFETLYCLKSVNTDNWSREFVHTLHFIDDSDVGNIGNIHERLASDQCDQKRSPN
jgi:hypothetical protein